MTADHATKDLEPAESDAEPEAEPTTEPEPPHSHRSERTRSRSAAPVALAVAVIAAALAVWALVTRPTVPAETGSAPTAQQAEEAKQRVCAAFDVVRTAVSVQTNANLGDDVVAREAVAANARLASIGGGGYLLSTVDPATPPELAEAARSFARLLQGIGARQLAGVPVTDPTLTAEVDGVQAASTRVAESCA